VQQRERNSSPEKYLISFYFKREKKTLENMKKKREYIRRAVYYPTLISSESHQRGDTPQKKKNISFYSIPFFLIYF
jgi:hypothetical protein